jgi:hypothetical protein
MARNRVIGSDNVKLTASEFENFDSHSSKYWQLKPLTIGELLSSNVITEQDGVVCIPEVSSSNLGQVSGHPERFRGIIQSLRENSGIVPHLGHDHFQILSNALLTNHFTIDAVQTSS